MHTVNQLMLKVSVSLSAYNAPFLLKTDKNGVNDVQSFTDGTIFFLRVVQFPITTQCMNRCKNVMLGFILFF